MALMCKTTDAGSSRLCVRRFLAPTLLGLCLGVLLLLPSQLTAQRMMPFSFWKQNGGAWKDGLDASVVDSLAMQREGRSASENGWIPGPAIDVDSPFPTPFGPGAPGASPGVSLRFRLADNGAVRVRLYSLLSQPLDEVLTAEYSAGSHAFTFTPRSDLPGGAYFLAFSTAGQLRLVKLLYVK